VVEVVVVREDARSLRGAEGRAAVVGVVELLVVELVLVEVVVVVEVRWRAVVVVDPVLVEVVGDVVAVVGGDVVIVGRPVVPVVVVVVGVDVANVAVVVVVVVVLDVPGMQLSVRVTWPRSSSPGETAPARSSAWSRSIWLVSPAGTSTPG
jgi:hypothetical protein